MTPFESILISLVTPLTQREDGTNKTSHLIFIKEKKSKPVSPAKYFKTSQEEKKSWPLLLRLDFFQSLLEVI